MDSAVSDEAVFGAEYVESSIDDAMPLIREHWDCLDHHGVSNLDLNVEAYKKLDESMLLRVFTARKSGQMVAYCVFFVKYSFISKNELEAVQLALFIKKSERGFGLKFLRYCDDMLKKEGVNVVCHSAPISFGLDPFFKRLGYKDSDKIYVKRLK